MKFPVPFRLALLALCGTLPAQDSDRPGGRFEGVDIFVNTGAEHLGAYQVEFKVTTQNAVIVGIEGGEHPAFKEAPYYDAAAMQQERVILAAFSLAGSTELPQGKTRVATIHLLTQGSQKPECEVRIEVAGNSEAKPISAEVTWIEKDVK